MANYTDEIRSHAHEARAALQAAMEALEGKEYEAAVLRAAESASHMVRALLLDEEIEPAGHGDLMTPLQEIFVQGRRLTKEQGADLGWLLALSRAGERERPAADEAQRAVEIAGSFFDAAQVILDA